MKTLYLIRHGCTEANVKKLYCGSTDVPLSKEGVEDLKKIHYQVPKDCIFIISGMMRTRQTLHYLFGDVPYTIDQRFREIDFGVFEMKSYEDLKDDPDYRKWISGNNDQNVPPGGESGIQLKKRVIEGLMDLQKESRDVVLIAHGGVIASIMSYLFPEEKKDRYAWQPGSGQGYIISEGIYKKL